MKDVKDIFSKQASTYASFRPAAPYSLLEYVYSKVSNFENAWDCGTGNGQIAAKLSERFDKVYATDISQQQLDKAVKKDNILYKLERAEQTGFADNMFDLITAAQAVHWFDINAFNKEVQRVARNGAVVAVWTYYLPVVSEEIDRIVDYFYKDIIGSYWDKERLLIDEHYQTIPFPFDEMQDPGFHIDIKWTADQLLGYLGTWSAVQHYRNRHNTDPLQLIKDDIQKEWESNTVKDITFSLYMRLGRVAK